MHCIVIETVVISRTMTEVLTTLTAALKGCLTLNGLRPVNNGERIAVRPPFLTLAEKSRNSTVIQSSNVSYVMSPMARRQDRFVLVWLRHRFNVPHAIYYTNKIWCDAKHPEYPAVSVHTVILLIYEYLRSSMAPRLVRSAYDRGS
jgi:hypothetical protein